MAKAPLWEALHYRIQAGDDEGADPATKISAKLVGTYSTREKAEKAIARLLPLAGFRDWPGGFRIYEVMLDRDLWPEGFAGTDTGERPRL